MINLTRRSEPSWWTNILNHKCNSNLQKDEWSEYQTDGPTQQRHQSQCLRNKWNHRKHDFSLKVNAAPFLFGTTHMAYYTKNVKEPQDEETTACPKTQSMFHQRIQKYNSRKPTLMMQHQTWLKRQSPNNDDQAVSPLQMKEGNRHDVGWQQIWSW